MRPLVNALLTLEGRRRRRSFAAATRDPRGAQARALGRIVAANRATAFGYDHGFGDIRCPRDYVARIPIRDYEGLRPYVQRMLAGEPRVLTAEAPFMFATTSGTTGALKYIPVTPGWANEMAGLMRLWTSHALEAHPALLAQKLFTMVSPAMEGVTPCGAPFGSMSGLTYSRLPWLLRRRHAVPYAATLLRDYDTRYFVALRMALGGRVSSIGTPNPTTLLRLAETAERRGEALVRAIHDGRLGVEDLEPVEHGGYSRHELRAELLGSIRPNPRRAATLADVIDRHGRLVLGDCWPDLALVGCWLGGNAGVHARRLREHFGTTPLRDLGLVASEGRMTVPVEDHTAAGVLAVHAGFFEFIPEEEMDDRAPVTLLCHELEVGRRYGLVITEANGLYRYDLNDVIEVTGFHHATPTIAFVRKGRDMLSITGEKLHLNHLLAALRKAERASGVEIWQFRVIPDLDALRYDVLVEPLSAVAGSAAQTFLAVFDAALVDENAEYAAKRASRRLASPQLHVMARGWAERLCRREFARGRRELQHKWKAVAHEWDAESCREVELRIVAEGRATPAA
jgi:hypothetical protein